MAFDIGGVISRYPEQMRALMLALVRGGAEVHVLTDMPRETARACLNANGFGFVTDGHLHCADWSEHGDLCKTRVCEAQRFDVLVDDRPDYVAAGEFIGLVTAPRPGRGYYAPEWRKPPAPTGEPETEGRDG